VVLQRGCEVSVFQGYCHQCGSASDRVAALRAENSAQAARIAELEAELATWRAEQDETPLTREWLRRHRVYRVEHYKDGPLLEVCGNDAYRLLVADDASWMQIQKHCGHIYFATPTVRDFVNACRLIGHQIKVEVGP